MSIINVQDWNYDQVARWIQGLEGSVGIYGPDFIRKHVNGTKLLTLMAGDLEFLGVQRVGDQILLYEAILSLRNELEADRITMQTLASRLSVKCKTYRSELSNLPRKKPIPNESLASAAYLLDSAKALLRWLTRYPFLGKNDYDTISRNLTRFAFELAMLSQRDSFADNAIEDVQYLCTKMIEICDDIIFVSKDSLILQPAAVDVITIRKRQEQELGLQFETSYYGTHLVSGVTLNSPAYQSGHLERGDEILQVNYQTVVAWNQLSVISLLETNPCEVNLMVKRRPRHANNMLGHMYRPKSVPARKLASPLLEEELETGRQEREEEKVEMTDKCEEIPKVANNAETRFWKLYPRPKNLIRRRATVSGASPTSTRPPVTFVKENGSGVQRRHPLDKSKSESHKLDLDDHILKIFLGKSNVQGSRITLPLMENLVLEGRKFKPLGVEEGDENAVPIPPAPGPKPPPPSDVSQTPRTECCEDPPPLPPKNSIPPPSSISEHHQPCTSPKKPLPNPEDLPIYTGYLHKRGQWKQGPRWTRFKATLSPKSLTIGTSVYKLGPRDFIIGLANEVHSRPFAFKLEEHSAEKSVIYVAAESHFDMQTWIKLLSIEMGLPPISQEDAFQTSSGPKLFRRSTSLQPGSPTFHQEKSQRRTSLSLPFQNKCLTNKVPFRSASSQLKSSSTSRLDEKRCLTSTPTPLPYTKSNISSITITSSKRNEGSPTIEPRPKPRISRQQHVQSNPMQPGAHYNPHNKPSRSSTDESSSRSHQNTHPNNPPAEKEGKPRMGINTLNWKDNWKDTNLNLNTTNCPNSSQCRTCGSRLNVLKTDSSTQTNDNLFILIKGDQQSTL